MTSLALLGRLEHLDAIDRAIGKVKTGGVVVLSLVGLAGSGRTAVLDEYQRRLHAAGIGTRRSTLFPASVTDPGGLADALGISLGEPLTEPAASSGIRCTVGRWDLPGDTAGSHGGGDRLRRPTRV
jgi:hypothetical protein